MSLKPFSSIPPTAAHELTMNYIHALRGRWFYAGVIAIFHSDTHNAIAYIEELTLCLPSVHSRAHQLLLFKLKKVPMQPLLYSLVVFSSLDLSSRIHREGICISIESVEATGRCGYSIYRTWGIDSVVTVRLNMLLLSVAPSTLWRVFLRDCIYPKLSSERVC